MYFVKGKLGGKKFTTDFSKFLAHSEKLAEVLSKSNANKITVRIANGQFKVMEKVINFLYSGKLDFSPNDVCGLFEAANGLKILVLKKFLMQQIREKFDGNDFLAHFAAAKVQSIEDGLESLNFFEEWNELLMAEMMKLEI